MSKMEYMDGYKQIKIDTLIIGGDKVFFSDEYRLSVVLENLLSNAIKYCDSEKENPFLHISIVVNDLEAEIKFQDNGIGIDGVLLNKIFNMFFRGTERSDGAGLGLYIVKETIEKLRGKITVSSTVHKGTDFKVLIPNLNNHGFTN
jgi:signal transduction histidine kinase